MARFAHTATFVPPLRAPGSPSADAGALLVFGGVDFVRDYADVASVQARRPPRAAAGALCAMRAPARRPACAALSRLCTPLSADFLGIQLTLRVLRQVRDFPAADAEASPA
jgi:hypothetical protein